MSYKAMERENYEELLVISREINQLIHFISQQLAGREEVIQQSFYALLTGENQLLFSRPGMAKSLLARQVFVCFHEVQVFEKQLTKDTMPDHLFGAYDIEAMRRGKMIHNIQGSIIEADFAFLDEIFDANDMVLRSLLSLLNEKRLVNGEQIVDSSLNTVIATANYMRINQVMEAVLDRFLYKSFIQENKDLYYQFSIDQIYQENTGEVKLHSTPISLDKFRKIKHAVKSQMIYISEYILFLKNYILRQYIEHTRACGGDNKGIEFTISDRTTAKAQDLLRASAILAGRTLVEEQDLSNLHHLVCMLGKVEEQKRLSEIIENTKRYFTSDREILTRALHLIGIFKVIKSSENLGLLMHDMATMEKIREIEDAFADHQTLMGKIKNFAEKIISGNQGTGLSKIIKIFEQACNLMKNLAQRKETIEIIVGLENDVEEFNRNYNNCLK